MRKYKKIKREYSEDKLIEVTCDFCGKKFNKKLLECQNFGKIRIDFRYGSNFDDNTFELHICDSCFIENFSKLLKKELKKRGFNLTPRSLYPQSY